MTNEQQVQDEPFEAFSGHVGYEGALEDNKWYNATVASLVVRDIQNVQYPGKKVIWSFSLDGSDESVEGMSSLATGEGSKAGEWLTAMFGSARVAVIHEKPIPRDEIIGQRVMVLVRINDKGYPSVRGVMPQQNAPQAAPQPQVAPTPTPAPAAPSAPSGELSQSKENFDDLPF